jgi:iron complex transport system permease protein
VKWLALGAAALLALLTAVVVGPAGFSGEPATVAIIRDLRIPRALLAFLVGGSLAVTGAALQALVRNPLADPYLLGLSGGAGLGAVGAIALHLDSPWVLPASAFVGALAAILVVYRLGVVTGAVLDPRVLLLAGVVVGAFAAAMMGAIMAVSPAAELRNAFVWLLGGFGSASWRSVSVFASYAAVPVTLMYLAARPLDLLTLGEEPATYLGADVERTKRRVYVAASLLTAAAVAVSGTIGFVGLVVPHAIRLFWGHLHRTLLPAAFLLGGTLLVFADALARTIFAPVELPVGVVTAFVGVPVFVLLLRRWPR